MSNNDNTLKFKSQRCDKFAIVLNDTQNGLILRNTDYVYRCIMCGAFDLKYLAVIKHDRDEDEYHNAKTLHYHVVLALNSRYRIGTIIDKLMDSIKGLNENQISIDKCSSLSAQSRYLIHLDDRDKYQYDDNDIVTNSRDTLDYFLKEIVSINDMNDLIAVVTRYPCLFDLMRVLGIDNYKKYRNIIKDIREWR